LSAMAFRSSLSCSSVTFCRSCPVCASMMSRFSISVARCSLTSRMRPSRSAASGSRIWFRIDLRASAVVLSACQHCWSMGTVGVDGKYLLVVYCSDLSACDIASQVIRDDAHCLCACSWPPLPPDPPAAPPWVLSCSRRAFLIYRRSQWALNKVGSSGRKSDLLKLSVLHFVNCESYLGWGCGELGASRSRGPNQDFGGEMAGTWTSREQGNWGCGLVSRQLRRVQNW
jgi:hypothetical protein